MRQIRAHEGLSSKTKKKIKQNTTLMVNESKDKQQTAVCKYYCKHKYSLNFDALKKQQVSIPFVL